MKVVVIELGTGAILSENLGNVNEEEPLEIQMYTWGA